MKKSLKRILCAMLVLVFVFANANVALAGNNIVLSSELIEPELYNTASNGSFDNLEKYIGDIDEFQRYVLDSIMVDDSNLTDENNRGYIDISEYNIPYTEELFAELSNLINNESPELFRIKAAGVSYYYGGNMIALTPTYEFSDPAYFRQEYELFIDVTEQLLNGIKGNETLSDVEKALLLHDRLAVYCEYDSESTIPSTSHSAYGAICLGVAVCQGYAYAYDYLLEQVGIEAEYCSSDVLCHAWNIVYIDNKPYHVDVTWDDPTLDMSGRVLHNNFLRSNQGIIETGHIKNEVVDYTTTPIDTTYDNAFWQNSNTEFQLINNKIYYVDNVKQELYVIDDITDTEPETIDSLDYKWTNADGSWWSGNYSKLASIRDNLFYSTPTKVYCYNVTENTSEAIITNEDILATTGEEGYRIYGMTAVGCTLWGEYVKSPNYNVNTKQEQIFTKGYHNPTENWKTVIEPTSSSQGKEKNYCIDCGREVGSRLIPALDDQHIWSDWYVDPNNKPTCTDKGVILRDCSHCGAQEWDYGTALGHDYSADFTIAVQPTCGLTGVKYRVCSRCEAKVDITTIPATNEHKASTEWVTGKVATCGSAGYEILPCLNCGAEMDRKTIAQLPHGETEKDGVKSPTCTTEGYTGDTRCKTCKTVLTYGTKIEKSNHTSSEWMTRIPATYLSDGVEYRICTVCKTELETRTIPKKVHSSDGGKITKPATCTESGVKTYTCTKCNEVIKTETIPATGHTTTVVNVTSATIEANGYTGDTVCTVCGTVTAYGTAIPKLTLSAPVITSLQVTTGGVKFTWTAVPNAVKYKVYRKTYHPSTGTWDSKWKKINKVEVKGTEYVDGTAKLGTQYMYLIKAVNGKATKNSAASSAITFKISPTPTAYLKSNGIKVKWPETVVSAESYRIYRADFNEATGKYNSYKKVKTVKGTTKSWTDTTVVSGKKYKYCVKAVRGKVVCDKVQTKSMYFLTKPTAKATKTANGIVVGWNQIQGATSFKIYRANFQNGAWTGYSHIATVGPTTSYLDSATVPGVQYKYKVKAVKSKTGVTSSATAAVIR